MGVNEIDLTGSTRNHSGRYGGRIRLSVGHTSEGGKSQTPEQLHEWMKNNGVSYHYIFGMGRCLAIVDTDRASWSCLDANGYTINAVFAGSQASMSRQEWLDRFGIDIRNWAEILVRDSKKYGFNARTITWDEIGRGLAGTIDHWGITMGLGIGDHTDVGRNFPWDVLRSHIEDFLRGAPAVVAPIVPTPNAIEELRKLPGFEWLGAKITTELEIPTPDGRGRWAKYEGGYIYWTPETGAIAIPNAVFEVWAANGFEVGIGFPVNFHTVINGGDIQAFEKGVIYRKYGTPGYIVHGNILVHYRAAGFEGGTLGWPTSNEVPIEGGNERIQAFENGTIVWSPNGTTALRPQDGPDQVLPTRTH